MTTIRAGSRVRAARLERGIGQGQLAAEAQISRQALSAIEAGAYTPNVTVALRLAQALGKSVETLFGDAGFESVTVNLAEETGRRPAPERTSVWPGWAVNWWRCRVRPPV